MLQLENVREWSINDCWLGILGNTGCDRLQTAINQLLAAFIGKRDRETHPAPSRKCASTECQ